MKAGTKLALGAIVIAVLLGLTPLGSTLLDLLVGGPAPDKALAPVTSLPIDPDTAPPKDVDPSPSAPQRRAAEAPANPVETEPAAAAAAAASTTGVRMRFVDRTGMPIEGVHVTLSGHPKTGVVSDARGVAKAWLDPTGRIANNRERVAYEHPTFAPDNFSVNLELGRLTEVGDVVLIPAGGIIVRVQSSGGVPVEGAWVKRFSNFELRYRTKQLEEQVAEHSLGSRSDQVTDASGRLPLEDLPAGQMRLWAGREGSLAGYSELFEVRPEIRGEEVVVTLGDFDPELFIRGRVVDSSDAGMPYAKVSAKYSYSGGSGSSSFQADKEGRFVLAYSPKAPRKVEAKDQEERYGTAKAEGVVGGDDIILRLTEPDYMLLTVLSKEEGAELEQLRAMAYNGDRTDTLLRGNQIQLEGSLLRIPLPDEAFLLEIYAEGHERLSLGPFDGLAAPRELDVTLRSLPGVRGHVTAGGEPVTAAEVELYALASQRTVHNGFPVRLATYPWAKGPSDAEGAFALTLRQGGEFFLRVEAEGFAPAEQGPWPIDPDLGRAGLAVELTRGGAIEGVVWGGEQVAGQIVAISRGDGHARTIRTDEKGRYRFDLLTPGPWQVELVREELSPNSSSTRTLSGGFHEADIDSNCVVLDGQTSRHDLSLTGAGQTALTGRLLLDGGAGTHWEARLQPTDDNVLSDGATKATVGQDGSFRIEAPGPGEYWLSLSPPQGKFIRLIERVLLVPGENLWEASFLTGGVSFSNIPPAESGSTTLLLVGNNGKTQLLMPVGGRFGLTASEGLPVMPCQLRRIDPSTLSGLEGLEEAGTLLLNVELRAGETVEVIVP